MPRYAARAARGQKQWCGRHQMASNRFSSLPFGAIVSWLCSKFRRHAPLRRDDRSRRRLAVDRTGEFFTLLGPSGCEDHAAADDRGFDARTMPARAATRAAARAAMRTARPSAADILDGQDLTGVPPSGGRCARVQSYALFPHMTVAANVAFPLKMGTRRSKRLPQGHEALSDVH